MQLQNQPDHHQELKHQRRKTPSGLDDNPDPRDAATPGRTSPNNRTATASAPEGPNKPPSPAGPSLGPVLHPSWLPQQPQRYPELPGEGDKNRIRPTGYYSRGLRPTHQMNRWKRVALLAGVYAVLLAAIQTRAGAPKETKQQQQREKQPTRQRQAGRSKGHQTTISPGSKAH